MLETELRQISSLNDQIITFSSVGSAALAYGMGIWTNAAFVSGEFPPVAVVMTSVAAPCLSLIAIVFFSLAWRATRSKNQLWETIDRESRKAEPRAAR